MFGDGISTEMFIRMVLGIDQAQIIAVLNGMIYHTIILDAFSGRTQTLQVLQGIVYTFGLVGFIILALQRSLWTIPIVVSWLALVLLLILGARGDVLFTPLDQDKAAFVQKLNSSTFSDPVTGLDNGLDAVQVMTGINATPPQPGQPLQRPLGFPRFGDMLAQTIESNTAELQKIGAFTPLVATLYTLNSVKYALLSGLSANIDVDVLSRSGMANRLAAGRLNPSAAMITKSFATVCSSDPVIARAMLSEDHLYNSPTKVGPIKLPNGQTIQQALTADTFTVADGLKLQRQFFSADTSDLVRYYSSMPIPVWEGGSRELFNDIPSNLALHVAENVSLGNNATGQTASGMANKYSRLQRAAKTDPAAAKELAAFITSLEQVPTGGSWSQERASIYIQYTTPGQEGADSATWTAGGTFPNCWEMYLSANQAIEANFGLNALSKRLGEDLDLAGRSTPGINQQAKLILGSGSGRQEADQALFALMEEERRLCAANNVTVASPRDKCQRARTHLAEARAMISAEAVKAEVGQLLAAEARLRDASNVFTSPVSQVAEFVGEKLGPVALWFFALFGGFSAGAYSAIVPLFMNFALMLILAVSPLMFLMGVLMPAWAPQIILTPIAVIAYIKIVEIMFVLVGTIFAALRVNLENSGVVGTQAIFKAALGGPSLYNTMFDIMVGMAYTSMFAIAGLMLVGIRSPDKIIGGLASSGDKMGNIEFKEVLQIAAAVKTAKTVAGIPLKVAGGAASLAGAASVAKGVIAKEGLIDGAGKLIDAKFGSLSGSFKEGATGLDAAMTKAEKRDEDYKNLGLPRHSEQLEEANKKRQRRIENEKNAIQAARAAGLDARSSQDPSFVDPETGIKYDAASPISQTYAKIASFDQKANGTEIERAEINAQNMVAQVIAQAKIDAQIEKDQWDRANPGASADERKIEHKKIDDRFNLLDGGTIDKQKKEVITEFNVSSPILQKFFAQNPTVASQVFEGQDFASGKVTLAQPMKAGGAGKGVRNTQQQAAIGVTPNAGLRSSPVKTYTEEEVREAKEKADNNGWGLVPKDDEPKR